MTEKRFSYNVYNNTIEENGKCVAYVNIIDGVQIAKKFNKLAEENEQLKKENQELRMSPRVDVNEIESLVCENEQLKNQNELLSDELEQCKAVIDKRWNEYLKKKELIE